VNTALASQTDTLLQYDGSTVALRARQQVTPGAHQLYFTIFDAGDHTYDSAVFLDNLRAFAATPAQCHPGARPVDSDGDGLPDDWETNGVDRNGDGRADVPLNLYGADPQHKDLFVQLDSMRGHQLPQAALDIPINGFANAPVTNPDGRGGITLHVDNGPNSTMNPRSGPDGGAEVGEHERGPPRHPRPRSRGRVRLVRLRRDQERELLGIARGRVSLRALRASLRERGYGEQLQRTRARGLERLHGDARANVLGGTDCTTGSVGAQGSTFMHEMGHTLGLGHGGPDGLNRKPNYLSVMNYNWQFPGLRRVGSTTPSTTTPASAPRPRRRPGRYPRSTRTRCWKARASGRRATR